MSTILDFAQFGVAIFALAMVYFTIKEIVSKFLEILKNDLEHLRQSVEKHTEIDDKLTQAVRELIDYLRHHNGKK